uniref:Geranyl diphsophate synthase small subunit n=1 Tax=Lavandula x intermedia TaxID=1196215 RepID=M4QSM8_LAVIN|nr:geranyl diphsophate synthase small subunit [Lavandula x intermedia]
MALNLSHLPIKTRSFFCNSSAQPVSAAQNASYWSSIDADINTYLKKAIPIRSPETVFEPMHHLTFAAPTTTASALCVAACELFGGNRTQALPAASAIHLIHAAAYTHDHLPLTDRPRPESKPDIQHKFNPNIELLTGDGIAPFGFELLANSVDTTHPDRILRVVIEISRASGSQGLVDGLYREKQIVDQRSRFEFIEYVSKKKYGEMHACGAASGVILAGGDEEQIQKLRNFGLYAGTVRGMIEMKSGLEKKNIAQIEKIIIKFQQLAMKEMEGFQGKNAELISSLVTEPILCPA